MKYLPLIVSLSLTIIISGCQVTQENPLPSTPENNQAILDKAIPNAKKLITGQLDNGMTYVIKKETHTKGRASLVLLVKAGVLQEDNQQRGVAHFVEHMAFNGTEDFPKNDLVTYIESAGMKFGQGINALTYFDKTVYSLNIPSNNNEVFENGFRIIENWAHKVSFDTQEIEKERGVILEELRSKDSANYRLETKHLQAKLEGSRYAQRYPLIGTPENIKSANRNELTRYYKKWYQPKNMVVLAVGDIDPVRAMFFINKYMEAIPSDNKNKSIPIATINDNTKPLVSIQTDPQAIMTQMSFHIIRKYQPVTTYHDELDRIKQLFLVNLFNRRLKNAITENKMPAISVNTSFISTLGKNYNFTLSATSKAAQSREVAKLLLAEMYRVNQDGFEEQELLLVKSALKNYTKDHKQNINLTKQINEYILHIMNEEPLYDTKSIAAYREETIAKITLEDINKLATDWLEQKQNRHIYISAPDSELPTLPTPTELVNLWEQAKNKNYRPYLVEQIPEKLMQELPSKGTIVNYEYKKLYRSHYWTLSNGAKVILRKRKAKGNGVLFQAIKDGGLEKFDNETYQKVANSTPFIDYMGIDGFSVNALNTFLYDKNIKLTSNIYALTEGLKGSASTEYLDVFMQLLYLKFTQPRKNKEDFNFLFANIFPIMEKNSQLPLAQFTTAINAEQNKHNPRFIEKYNPETLKLIDFDLSYKIFKQRFENASDFTFTFIGDVEIDQMEELITTYIASLPSGTSKPTHELTHQDKRTKGHIEVHLNKGVDQKGFVKLEMGGEASWSNENEIVFEAVRNTLNVLLRNKVRETLGGTYEIAVKGQLRDKPRQEYLLSIEFFCEPERVDELVNAVRNELARVKNEGISLKLLDSFKKQQAHVRKKQLSNHRYWLYRLSNLDEVAIFDLDVKLYDKTLADITLEQVNQAIKQYLNAPNSLYATLLPENSTVELTTKQSQ
tara:strand:+ start:16649 stop:19522 length:2874 start_codon:yes stop_codon:yes gene_type:complete